MKNSNSFLRYSWFIFAMVFLVILAGGIVRMTQSGMGCPDWPKCFGMWIPPTDASQLPEDFEKYLSKQDIDHTFNVYHTWIEYVNRLLGALLGVFIFIYFIWSVLKYRTKDKWIWLSTLLLVLLTGFQGWLGKIVVDANLSVVKVTLHMIFALIIAAVPLFIISRIQEKRTMIPKWLKTSSLILLACVILQIILGTQVREEIDIISKALSYEQRNLWIDGLGTPYYIHRSFSWIILIISASLWYKTKEFKEIANISFLILFFVLIAIIAGLIMNFLSIPAIMQPIHLVIASLLSMAIVFFILKTE